jgi:hypothetical protein
MSFPVIVIDVAVKVEPVKCVVERSPAFLNIGIREGR